MFAGRPVRRNAEEEEIEPRFLHWARSDQTSLDPTSPDQRGERRERRERRGEGGERGEKRERRERR
jgi:hypothetical protein